LKKKKKQSELQSSTTGMLGILATVMIHVWSSMVRYYCPCTKECWVSCCLKKRPRCWSVCFAASFLLTIFFSLAIGLSLTDEILFLFIKKVCFVGYVFLCLSLCCINLGNQNKYILIPATAAGYRGYARGAPKRITRVKLRIISGFLSG